MNFSSATIWNIPAYSKFSSFLVLRPSHSPIFHADTLKNWEVLWYPHGIVVVCHVLYVQGCICIEPTRVCDYLNNYNNITWTNYVEVLLRCLYGNININLCFSFLCFVREEARPPPAPTPLGRQGSPLLQLLPYFPQTAWHSIIVGMDHDLWYLIITSLDWIDFGL